jgi:hypothetical protein
MNIVNRRFIYGRIFALLLALTAFTACGDEMDEYKQTVRSGLVALPWPSEMAALFGDADHFITHYGFSPVRKSGIQKFILAGAIGLRCR